MPKTINSLIVSLLMGAVAIGVAGGLSAGSSGQPPHVITGASAHATSGGPSPGDMTWG
jgi:hypothetical protein